MWGNLDKKEKPASCWLLKTQGRLELRKGEEKKGVM